MSNLGKTIRDVIVTYIILDIAFKGCVGWFVFFLSTKQKETGLHRKLGAGLLAVLVTQFIVTLKVITDKINYIQSADMKMYMFTTPETRQTVENLYDTCRTSMYIVMFTIAIGFWIWTIANVMGRVDE